VKLPSFFSILLEERMGVTFSFEVRQTVTILFSVYFIGSEVAVKLDDVQRNRSCSISTYLVGEEINIS
jgi:hypothetical protein